MFHKLEKFISLVKSFFAVAVILFGVAYGLRCLFAGQIFCTVCFALIAYVSGYRLLLRASLQELREFNSKQTQA